MREHYKMLTALFKSKQIRSKQAVRKLSLIELCACCLLFESEVSFVIAILGE